MIGSRRWHSALLMGTGRVVVIGGDSGDGSVPSAELFDPATGTFSGFGYMRQGRQHLAAGLFENGWLFVVGGIGDGGQLTTTEVHDPATLPWSASSARLPAAMGYVNAVVLPDDLVVIAGGADVYRVCLWSQDSITCPKNLEEPLARFGATTTLLADGTILVTGGELSPSVSGGVVNTARLYVFR